MFESINGQLAVWKIEIFESQTGGEELFEGCGYFSFWFLGEEGVLGEVEVGQMTGAAPDQSTEQDLWRNIGGAEVQDGDNVGLGEEVHQTLHLVLEDVTSEVQVGETVEGELVGDESIAERVNTFARDTAVRQVEMLGASWKMTDHLTDACQSFVLNKI